MILAIIVMIVAIYLAIRGISDPFFALLAFLTVYVIQPGELYPALGYLHVERVFLIVMVVSFVANGRRLRFPRQTKAFLCFYAAMIIAVPLAFWVSNSLQFCISFFETVLIHLFVVSLLTSEVEMKRFLVVWASLTAWLGASALYMYQIGVRQFTMGIDRAEGLTSAGGDPNTLAITMVISMPISILLMVKGNPKHMRLLGLVTLLVSLATIVKTGSRTAFLALILLVLLTMFQEIKNLKYIPLALIAAPLFWLVIPAQYKARYQSIETRNSDESYTNRLLSWEGGRQMFLHNPLTGIGPGNYAYANGMRYWPGYPRHWLEAHSLYFKLLGELGSIGVITFGSYVVLLIQLNRSSRRRLKGQRVSILVQNFPMYCNLSIIMLLFTGYSAHNLYRSTWFILGAISAAVGLLKIDGADSVEVSLTSEKLLPAWIPSQEADGAEDVPTPSSHVSYRPLVIDAG